MSDLPNARALFDIPANANGAKRLPVGRLDGYWQIKGGAAEFRPLPPDVEPRGGFDMGRISAPAPLPGDITRLAMLQRRAAIKRTVAGLGVSALLIIIVLLVVLLVGYAPAQGASPSEGPAGAAGSLLSHSDGAAGAPREAKP